MELEANGGLFCFSHLPRIYQAFLMSATFNEDVQTLKELVLHNPVSSLCRHLRLLTCTLKGLEPPAHRSLLVFWGAQLSLV